MPATQSENTLKLSIKEINDAGLESAEPKIVELEVGKAFPLEHLTAKGSITFIEFDGVGVKLKEENLSPKPFDPAGNIPNSMELNLPVNQPIFFYPLVENATVYWELTFLPSAPEKNATETKKIRMPKMNWLEIQESIKKLEIKLGTKVISYYLSPTFDMKDNQAEIFYEHLKLIGAQQNLSVLLVGPGGSPTAALRIATILRSYCDNLQIIVPSVCASADTLLALSADKIIMTASGYLTAVDASLRTPLNPRGVDGNPVSVSTVQISKVIQFLTKEGDSINKLGQVEGPYRTLFHYLHPLVIGEITRNASLSEMIAAKIMRLHPDSFQPTQIEEIARKLVNDYPIHSYPILFEEAKEIGLPVEKADQELTELAWEIVKLYGISSLPTKTHSSPTFYHLEEYPVVIESIGRRIIFRVTFDKRLIPTVKNGLIENDNTGWYNVTANQSGPNPYKISFLDVPLANSTPTPSAPTTS